MIQAINDTKDDRNTKELLQIFKKEKDYKLNLQRLNSK
jgi:hypothetical protein